MRILLWIAVFTVFMAINLFAIYKENGYIQIGAFIFLGVAYSLIEKKIALTRKKNRSDEH